jgi:hypothetical protein
VEAAVRSSGAAAGYTADQLKRLAEGLEEPLPLMRMTS